MPVARTALAAVGLLAALGTTAAAPLSAQTAVTVDSLRMLSSAGNDSTYVQGDTIRVGVYYSSNTDVNSIPSRLYLKIGTETRTALWTGPSDGCDCGSGGATWFRFRYVVQPEDVDADGITTDSLGAYDITAADGTAINGSLTGVAITNAAAHKVDGALGYPKVTGVTISSSAGADNTYNVDDTIAVTVAFDSTVAVTGTPQLALGIGSATRQANYASGTGSTALVFRYVVVVGDEDTDGISIGANALTLNGGTIRLGTKNAVLSSLASHAITNAAAHKVDTPPAVTDVVFPNSPAEGDSLWRRLEHMRVSVHFTKSVWVTGSPRLALTIGANTRQASYQSGSGSDSLVFSYRIEDTDEDTTGVSIGASALTLNSGTIKASSDSTDAALSLGSHAVSNAAAHKVDGITRFASGVVFVTNPGADSTFAFGDQIIIDIYFNNIINGPGAGSVTLNVQIGTRTVPFAYTGVAPNYLSFTHYVTTDDIDADGLSVPENALSGSVSGGGRAAVTGLRGHAITNDPTRKVNGLLGLPDVQRTSITSDAGTDSTYVRGDVIEIGVVFDENVTVTGTPQLALTIGANTRQARYVSGSGGDSLTFRYATLTTDADADGISYSANALTLNGGTIKGTVVYGDTTRNAHLGLKTNVVANGAAHKVDGSQGPPVVVGVAIASDAGADSAYVVGDTIEVDVVFVENVDVTGTPQLALTIGSQARQASYASGTGGDSLTFRYVAVAGDIDTDGLSIGESALTLNSGTIRRAGSTTVDASLGLSIYTVTNAAAHKVLAVQGLPHVTGTAITSDPGTDSTYAAGDTIEVAVVFNENVNVTGTPQLALEIGAATRQASYVSGTGGDSLTFRYVTVAADTDTTGISYSVDALTLNGGTIRRVATVLDAVVSLLTHVVTNDAAHQVRPTSNKVTGLSVNSAGPDSTFVRGDTMKVTLAFRETTVVTGAPRIRMWLGATSRWATYHSGSGTSELEFRYVVEVAINDGTGVGILADAVDLNGGTVRAANQVAVSVAIPMALTIVDDPAWKVAGSTRITSASVGRPPTGNVFERGDTIVVTMVYSDSVDVTGVPTAWLNFASASHNPALYASGTGTDTLKFRYVVQSGDADPDGLSLYGNAIQLTGGSTIREAGTTTSAFHDTPWPHLGQNALTNSPDHIVAGAERITSVSLGPPPVGDTFERGDTIKVIVVYSGSVDVTGVPTVWMNIGSNNYAGATYASGTGTDTLEFHRVVEATDIDGDGISIGGNALQLTGTPASTITDAGTNVAVLGGTPWGTSTNAITNSANHKVQGGTFTAAAVSGVAVTSSPSSGDTYELGERIEVEVSFNRNVVVTGAPQLALEIGSDTVQAAYASGTGTTALAFQYAVTAADADSTGISIGASALALNGGMIDDARDTTVAASLGLGSNAIANATAHKVDGAQGPPGVVGVVVGSPLVGDTFERGETIEVKVAFNKSVAVTGTPRLALGIGSATKQADYASGTGTDTLAFRYVVVAADADADGLSIGSGALALNSGTIRVSGGATNAVLGLGVHAITNSTGHKVAGGTFTTSAPSGVAITSAPASDSTYGRTERIEVEVSFTRPVVVTGTPQLALAIDTLTRQASYASGSGTATLAFHYTVVAADSDSTGISIGASALTLNSGTINDARDGSTAAGLGLGSHAIANAAAHKVDGNVGPPSVTDVSFEYDPHNATYERGEQIGVRVQFHRAVDVTGTPQLALGIGSATRQASYVSGTGTTTLLFRYTVVQSDDDGNGISIGASALTLNGGTIRLSGAMVDAVLDLGSHAVANEGFQRVDGSQFTTPYPSGMAVRSSPASANTYQLGERILVLVTFTTPVTVTGTPRVALGIGSATRQAEYARGTGTRDVWFHYTVAAADVDADGISIGGSALALNGGTINDARAGGSAALLTLAGEAFSNDGDHRVNGGLGAPSVVGVSINDAPADSTFELSDVVVVTVEFNAAVTVTGTPRVRVGVGSSLRNAWYQRGSGTTSLEFEYTVVQTHVDTDGISIGASALETPSGSTIRRSGTTTDALLGLGVHAISNSAAHKVAGNTVTTPVVKGMRVSSTPAVGDTYLGGEAIEVEVEFVRGVYVGGTPQLALEVGDSTRQAEYNRRDATFTRVTFRYVVQATDMDADGISVGAGALVRSAGDTIGDGRQRSDAADLALGSHTFTNAAGHKVQGNIPYVTSVFFLSATLSGINYASTDSVFGLGDLIRVGVGFNTGVTVTGTPSLALGIGAQTRSIAQCGTTGGGTILVFCYTVVAADADSTGISIGANALTLPGGATIRGTGTTTDARLTLTPWSFADAAAFQVDGTKEVAPGVSGVTISSTPASDSTYGRTEAIEVEVEFERPVAVTGTPQLALSIDTLTRQASYTSGSETRTLVFRYTVVAADADSTGISIGASALGLGGGTIVLAGGTAAASLGLGTNAIANAAAHKVDGSLGPPGVTELAISSPVVGDTFERGETIGVELTFSRAVDVTGAPRLALGIGSATRQASYASGTGTTGLLFQYVVASGDADADGLSIGASALALNGGTIRLAGGALDATLGLGASAVTNSADHKVAGGTFTTPSVSAVTVSSAPAADSTYKLGESIEVKVAFGRPVAVTGSPRLALTIGTATRQASYDSASSKVDTLVFGYSIRPVDADTDGISIGASALALNGGTIADVRPGAAAAALGLGSSAVTNDAAHKVDGLQGPPGVTNLTVASPPVGTTFERGDTIVATVRFNKSVDVTGTPQLALGIGAQTRQAAYASGTGSSALVFRYVVVVADVDADGLSVGASALTLNGGTIDVAGGTTDALLSLEHQAFSNFLVVNGGAFTAASVAGVTISSTPASDSTYGRTERIEVEVTFNRRVAVTDTPQVALTIGSQTRQAEYASGTGTKTLTFGYAVVAADTDANGISIGASALALNGGTISDARDATVAAGLGLGSYTIANAAAHKVDGAQGPPGVTGLVVASPPTGDTFERGDAIAVTVTFNRAVDVTGTPQLALGIGTQTRQAAYASGTGTTALVFQYTVVTADVDADGISIGTSALALNSGTIRLSGGTLDATLGLGTHAVTNSTGHKVAGGTFTASSVSGVTISSSPSSGDTYGLGEEIEVEVSFVRPVVTGGTPQLALTVGARTRQAEYASGTFTKTLTFSYEVLAADADSNGISIGASALALNGGTINDARGGSTAASLGLGSSAITNAASHKVDGALGPPGVSALAIGSPHVGDTFERGETIEVKVAFTKAVAVTGTPQLALGIGSATKQASYAAGTGTDTLVFRYVVVTADEDSTGISIGTSALALNGGTIRVSGGTTDAVLSLRDHFVTDNGNYKVAGGTFTAAAVSGVTISSTPSSDSTYGRTERIEVEVGFTRPVAVTGTPGATTLGTPYVLINVGSVSRFAYYAGGTGTGTLRFGYTVVAADEDSTGISIGASALALNSGAINDARDGTAASLGLGSNAISNAAAHKVDGSRGPPGVTGLAISAPTVGDTFERGETIEVSLVFNRSVDVTGVPRLALTIGSAPRQASYASGTGTDTLVFRYVVTSGDADADGISIGASALALNGGTIRVAGGTLDAALGLGASVVTNSGSHKVAGGTFTTPAVSAVTISSAPAADSTYKLGESIEVKVAFGRPVAVTGTPRLVLTIGTQTRQASYVAASSKADTLVFGYAVRPADADTDGISIGASALTLNGGSIADVRPGAAAAALSLGSNAVSNAAAHKVNGSLGPPGVVGLSVAAPLVGSTFERGDTVVATVTFNKAVDVTGAPQLALSIGAQQVGAYAGAATGTTSLEFRYVVISGDVDTDGLSIRANALTLNGGTIDVAGGTTDALLSLAHHAISNDGALRVAGGTFTAAAVSEVSITSSPAGASTYGLSEEIEVEVTFNRNVTVTGAPQLALTIGSQTRQAAYDSATSVAAGGRVLTFRYTVAAADADANGISIGASALTLNGGTIADARDGSTAASLGLGSHAIANSTGHRVDGAQGPPGVSGVSIASPPVGDTFERGDTIIATVTFNKGVDVTGTPQLALTIGTQTRQAGYASGTGTVSLVFRYVVVTADVDADGLSIGASALALNGGMIDVANGTVDAVLGLGAHAVTNSAGHKVAGGTFTAASVSGVSLTSSPAVATTYGRGEQIEVQVTFNRRVSVTGTPQVALTVGAQTRQAGYASGTGTTALVFRYTVVAADADTDGIEVGASALALNSGTIADARNGTTAAALGLGSHALSAAAGHKVDGTLAGASVSGVVVSSTPESGDTYGLGERIEVQVTFDRAVTVTGAPQLALTVGTATRQASYVGGSGTATLSFAYRVQGAGSGGSGTGGVDADADGVGVAAAALTLNGATIVNTADGVRPAVLALGSHAITAAANDKVDGTVEAAPVVVGLAVTSTPGANGLYGPRSVIRVAVTFSRPVEVAGAPQQAGHMSAATVPVRLEIEIGTAVRHASYVSGSGTPVLVFEYVVQPADRDEDGISIPADALTATGGALRIAGGTTAAALDLSGYAVENLEEHQVNGAGGTDPVFGRAEYEFKLTEDVAGPVVVGTVSATDPFGGEVTYSLAAGDEGLFEVDARTGEVRYVGTGEDAESRSEFVMIVRATADDGERTGDATVTVRLVNVNDAPVFTAERYAFDMAENVAGPLALGVAEAVDLDEGDTLTYRLAAGDADRFEVDGATGAVRYVGGGEDYEGAGPKSWELKVTATDLSGLTAEAVVAVALTNVNEGPAFADSAYAFDLAENVRGPLLLGEVRATDPDGGDWLSYALTAGDAERFKVNATSGAVRYVGSGEDAETGPGSWELEVTATDRGGLTARTRVVVTLEDQNEGPVFVESIWEWELAEHVAGPVELGAIEATDVDVGDTLRYSLSGAGAALFDVGESSGVVRYVGAGEDAETGPEGWEFEVVATDRAGLAAVAKVRVLLLDVNEAPAFVDSAYAFELAENARGPRELGRVEATDPDRDDALTYSLAQGDAGRFQVDGASGAVRYVGAGEDYEDGPPEFALTVRVTDTGGLTVEAAVMVTLLDVNEGPEAVGSLSPPVLEVGGAPWEVGLGEYFRDPDGDALSYVVVSSSPDVAAASVSGAGRLSVVPRGIGASVLTVTATDAGGLTATQQASVTVSASRSDRARALKLTLAAFGRSLGTETVDAIGGRLGLESSGSPGGSHVQLGGRSLSCVAFGGGRGLGGASSGTASSRTFGDDGAAGGADADQGESGHSGAAGTPAAGQGESAQASTASSHAGSSRWCGLESLVRDATGLLGFQITHPGTGSGPGGIPSGTLDLAAIFFGDGATGMGAVGGASLGQGGSYQGQREEGALPAERERGGIAFSPLTGRDLRSRSSFQLSFGGSGGEQGGADADGADASPAQTASQAGWTLWGQANVGEFEGRPEDDFAMDGRTRSAYVGLDYRFGSGFLMGVAGSRSDVAANYESGINGAGKTKAHLTSLYPYLSWSSQGGFGIWGLAGAGMGAANVGEMGPTYDADLRMRMGALGVRQKLVGGLALKADAFAVRMMTDASNGHVAAVTADAQRVRLAPELGGQWSGGSIAMRTRIEVGGRYDRGDAETGMGAEAGAELGFTHAGSGLSLDARGRMLLIHQDRNFKDWGAAVALRIQPRSEAGGLSFSLEPSWGNAAGGAQTLWQGGGDVWRSASVTGLGAAVPASPGSGVPAGGGQAGHGGPTGQGGPASLGAGPAHGFPSAYGFGATQDARGWTPDRLAMEVGYGVALPGGSRIKPFGRWSREGAAGYRLNVGTQWATLGGETAEQQTPGLRLVMDFFGEQVATGFQPPERRVGLLGKITF